MRRLAPVTRAVRGIKGEVELLTVARMAERRARFKPQALMNGDLMGMSNQRPPAQVSAATQAKPMA